MSNILVEVARKEARRRLEARGLDSGLIDRLPSIEDGFVNWLSRSGMPMEAIDDMLDQRGGFVDRSDLSTVVERTTGHAPPDWVLDLLMTSMDASGDGLVSNHELWRWAAARGLDVPEALLEDQAVKQEEEAPPEEQEEEPEPTPEPVALEIEEEVTPEPVPEPQRQPVPPPEVHGEVVDGLPGIFSAMGQNSRGVEISAIVAANPQQFHIQGTVLGQRATLLGEPGWREGVTLGVATTMGEVDLQFSTEETHAKHTVDRTATLVGWNRGLARPVFRAERTTSAE